MPKPDDDVDYLRASELLVEKIEEENRGQSFRDCETSERPAIFHCIFMHEDICLRADVLEYFGNGDEGISSFSCC